MLGPRVGRARSLHLRRRVGRPRHCDEIERTISSTWVVEQGRVLGFGGLSRRSYCRHRWLSHGRVSVGALGKIGPGARTAVPALIDVLKDPQEIARLGAVGALGRIGPGAAAADLPLLDTALSDRSDLVRRYAAEALWQLGPDAARAVAVLMDAMSQEASRIDAGDALIAM